jgi:hypothetical protein
LRPERLSGLTAGRPAFLALAGRARLASDGDIIYGDVEAGCAWNDRGIASIERLRFPAALLR